jgi:phosphoglycolate phosphatase
MVATLLYQSGIAWNRARGIVASTFLPIFGAPPETDEIRAIGNVVERLRGFKAGGLQIAVATNDERSSTLTALQGLGVLEFVDEIVCGDDAGLAGKPSPDGLIHIARILGIPPKRLVMVGDSVSDMVAGKAAGVSLTVGVLSGPSKSEQLAGHADVIVPDIHSLEVH